MYLGVVAKCVRHRRKCACHVTIVDHALPLAGFCACAQRVVPSIRDVRRCVHLFNYFCERSHREFFLGDPTEAAEVITQAGQRVTLSVDLLLMWKALVLALALTYYLRLDSKYQRPGSDAVVDLRAEFLVVVAAVINASPSPLKAVAVQARRRLDFQAILEDATQWYFDQCDISPGIAPTYGFREGLWATAVCLQVGFAVMLTGPSGCGKTLQLQVSERNCDGRWQQEQQAQVVLVLTRSRFVFPWVRKTCGTCEVARHRSARSGGYWN